MKGAWSVGVASIIQERTLRRTEGSLLRMLESTGTKGWSLLLRLTGLIPAESAIVARNTSCGGSKQRHDEPETKYLAEENNHSPSPAVVALATTS